MTHLHPEGIIGAVAAALASGQAAHTRRNGIRLTPTEFVDTLIDHLDDGATTRLIRRARTLLGIPAAEAAAELGNGSLVTAQNTVPFTIWVAATHLGDYPRAIATCIAADGDIDTTCAIAGGIVAAHNGIGADRNGISGVPPTWLAAGEPLPDVFDGVRRTRRRHSGRIRRWLSGRP